MGTAIPPGWPKIENDKIYKVTCDCFYYYGTPGECGTDFYGTHTECLIGSAINWWYELDYECTWPLELVTTPFGFTCQRVTSIIGPFESGAACRLTL